jgi:hypothetical protein
LIRNMLLKPALEAQWAADVPKELDSHLREMCENRRPSLLDRDQRAAFAAARRLTSGQGTRGLPAVGGRFLRAHWQILMLESPLYACALPPPGPLKPLGVFLQRGLARPPD